MRVQLQRPSRTALACLAVAGTIALFAGPAGAANKVYTVGNYPVEARAGDAVAAKSKAIAEGQKAAFRSLLKRIVPVTAYARLKKIANANVANLVDGTAVRSERNSSTEYIANLDFTFNADAVKTLLLRENIPLVDTQAAVTTVVPVWHVPAGAALPPGLANGAKTWGDAWRGLDTANAVAPVKIVAAKGDVLPETLQRLADGDRSMLRTFASSYGGDDQLVVAIATPDAATKRLNVMLIGTDAVEGVTWKHAYRIDPTDASYTVELASVVSLKVLEGRYKAVSMLRAGYGGGGAPAPGPLSADPSGSHQFNVEFNNMAEWQAISRKLSGTPGIQDLDVAGLSNRGARVILRYPGSMAALADALSRQGLSLRNNGQSWTLSGQ